MEETRKHGAVIALIILTIVIGAIFFIIAMNKQSSSDTAAADEQTVETAASADMAPRDRDRKIKELEAELEEEKEKTQAATERAEEAENKLTDMLLEKANAQAEAVAPAAEEVPAPEEAAAPETPAPEAVSAEQPAPAPEDIPADAQRFEVNTAVKLHTEADSSSHTIMVLQKGVTGTVLESNPSHRATHVRTDDGTEGWAHTDCLSII